MRSAPSPVGAAVSRLCRPTAPARSRSIRRLSALDSDRDGENCAAGRNDPDAFDLASLCERFGGRLGRAGFVTDRERRLAVRIGALLLCAAIAAGAVLERIVWPSRWGGVGALVGAYIGTALWLFYLARRKREEEREILFQLPLALESIILLVEAGLGILPAIERIVVDRSGVAPEPASGRNQPVHRALSVVYRLASHGVPLCDALEATADAIDSSVLRHVLLHLDIGANEGGELVPSLRSLSEHTHSEWRLSVEARVKRLENNVVFPVFASVLGLLLLAAAVPLVPVVDFMKSLEQPKQVDVSEYRRAPHSQKLNANEERRRR